jgi:glyoxylase-like metal-dependent hydrolase (beta-lactamase superfamily II)
MPTGARLLVDPGIATWETREAAHDGATHILITHADWDHVMGIGLLPDAQVWASQSAAERIRSGEAQASVESESNGALMRVSPIGIFCFGNPPTIQPSNCFVNFKI